MDKYYDIVVDYEKLVDNPFNTILYSVIYERKAIK